MLAWLARGKGMDAVGVRNGHEDLTLEQKMDLLLDRVGQPSDGNRAATGLWGRFESLDGRLMPFEKMYQQASGGIKVLTITVPTFAVVLWFVLKEKLKKLFGG